MAVTLTNAAKSAAANAVVDLLDVGSANSTGDIEFTTSGGTSLVVCNLANPAFGAATNGVATAGTVSQGTVGAAITNQTIAIAKFRDRDNAEVFRGSVGLSGSGADIILSGTVVSTDDTVDITALTYTQP